MFRYREIKSIYYFFFIIYSKIVFLQSISMQQILAVEYIYGKIIWGYIEFCRFYARFLMVLSWCSDESFWSRAAAHCLNRSKSSSRSESCVPKSTHSSKVWTVQTPFSLCSSLVKVETSGFFFFNDYRHVRAHSSQNEFIRYFTIFLLIISTKCPKSPRTTLKMYYRRNNRSTAKIIYDSAWSNLKSFFY